MIQRILAIWSLVPLPFLNPVWTSGSSRFTYCWSLTWSSQFTYCWSLLSQPLCLLSFLFLWDCFWQCYKLLSIVLQAFWLPDLISWMYSSPSLYNYKVLELGHTWMTYWFPSFSSKFEFCSKELIIWARVSSKFCFCWLFRASPSLAPKNIINLALVLTICWCPCVESHLGLLEKGICCDQCFLWHDSARLCAA